jgi:hypothetical protein
LFQEIYRLVYRNAVNPGIETGPPFERPQCLKRLDERFLRQIIRVLVVGRHVIDGGVNPLLITAHQIIVGRHVAVARALHQIGFIRLGAFGRGGGGFV